MIDTRRISLLLLVSLASAVSVVSLYRQWVTPLTLPPLEVALVTETTDGLSGFELFQSKPVIFYSEIIERPMFSRTRSPFVPESPPESSPHETAIGPREQKSNSANEVGRVPRTRASAPPQLMAVLIGIVADQDDQRAILIDGRSGEQHTLRVGETFDGWSLVDLTDIYAVLRSGGRETRLELDYRE